MFDSPSLRPSASSKNVPSPAVERTRSRPARPDRPPTTPDTPACSAVMAPSKNPLGCASSPVENSPPGPRVPSKIERAGTIPSCPRVFSNWRARSTSSSVAPASCRSVVGVRRRRSTIGRDEVCGSRNCLSIGDAPAYVRPERKSSKADMIFLNS